MLKTSHPPVTYRVALMPARRPACPLPSFSMILHNKNCYVLQNKPQNPTGKATWKPYSKGTEGSA